MAAYFTLTPKGATEREGFATVDDKICTHFGVEPDEKYYYKGWYDSIGLAIALGHDWTKRYSRTASSCSRS